MLTWGSSSDWLSIIFNGPLPVLSSSWGTCCTASTIGVDGSMFSKQISSSWSSSVEPSTWSVKSAFSSSVVCVSSFLDCCYEPVEQGCFRSNFTLAFDRLPMVGVFGLKLLFYSTEAESSLSRLPFLEKKVDLGTFFLYFELITIYSSPSLSECWLLLLVDIKNKI